MSLPAIVAILLGLALIFSALWDAFETVVLPRRVSRRLRVAALYYVASWRPYRALARRIKNATRAETFLSYYGPLSLLGLVALWAVLLIVGFAVLQWGDGSAITVADNQRDFWTDLYFSGTTFFTLGLGDVVPTAGFSRLITAIEGGTGFAFLALLIGYLPIIYQMFARRETNVSLLDQRAGSPPTAAELLRRNVVDGDVSDLITLLHDWEIWVADLLESHLSYPTLAYFRSQHENQSWVAALAVILDLSAYVLACGRTEAVRQAGFTFAVGRHAVGDLSNVFGLYPEPLKIERLNKAGLHRLVEVAEEAGLLTNRHGQAGTRLLDIARTYEPYLAALSDHLLMPLPPWLPADDAQDNWETTAWDFASPVDLFDGTAPFRKTGTRQPQPTTTVDGAKLPKNP